MPPLRGYRGIREYWPRVPLPLGLKAYIALLRPLTLAAPLLAGVLGVLAPVGAISPAHFWGALLGGVALALIQAVGQSINQMADSDLDAALPGKRHRPIPSGLVSKEGASGAAWLLSLVGVGVAFAVAPPFGFMVLALLFFSVFYSTPPLSPRKIHPLVNAAWLAASRGFIPMVAVWSVYGGVEGAWRYALLASVWVMGFQGTKDVVDAEGDRQFGIKTIPNAYGVRGLVAVMVAATAAYSALSIALCVPHMLLVLPLAAAAIFTVRAEAGAVENTWAWVLMYTGLSAVYILMFAAEQGLLAA